MHQNDVGATMSQAYFVLHTYSNNSTLKYWELNVSVRLKRVSRSLVDYFSFRWRIVAHTYVHTAHTRAHSFTDAHTYIQLISTAHTLFSHHWHVVLHLFYIFLFVHFYFIFYISWSEPCRIHNVDTMLCSIHTGEWFHAEIRVAERFCRMRTCGALLIQRIPHFVNEEIDKYTYVHTTHRCWLMNVNTYIQLIFIAHISFSHVAFMFYFHIYFALFFFFFFHSKSVAHLCSNSHIYFDCSCILCHCALHGYSFICLCCFLYKSFFLSFAYFC